MLLRNLLATFSMKKGEVVYKVPRIGIELQDLEKSRSSWQSRAENQKLKAIRAYMKMHQNKRGSSPMKLSCK